jgi:hypothetical protein
MSLKHWMYYQKIQSYRLWFHRKTIAYWLLRSFCYLSSEGIDAHEFELLPMTSEKKKEGQDGLLTSEKWNHVKYLTSGCDFHMWSWRCEIPSNSIHLTFLLCSNYERRDFLKSNSHFSHRDFILIIILYCYLLCILSVCLLSLWSDSCFNLNLSGGS